MFKKIFRTIKRMGLFGIFAFYIPRLRYPKYCRNLKIHKKSVLLESQHGSGMQGNMFYMLRTLATDPEYSDYTLYLSCRKSNKKEFRTMLDSNGMEKVILVVLSSRKYMKALATSEYLFNDNTFLPFFVKRDEQIYLNTWHGTPLKTLGRKIANAMHGIGNAQKNFIVADYLLYPNEYTMKHMVEDYMLNDIAKGKILLGGYPRNVAFFDDSRAAEIKKELGLEDKTIYAYMPTWRGAVGAIDPRATTYTQYYLYEMDKRLNKDEILYVNLHPIAKKDVVFGCFKHVRPFPEEYETYEFLNIADCLITDYSSVFYDFAVSRKKIVLFTYDEEEYFADRGLYRPLSSLPFPNVKTADALFEKLRSPKNYDDTEFIKEYCAYDRADASKSLCDRVILGKNSDAVEERDIPNNGRKNVLLYVGNLSQNGITASMMNLMENVDHDQYNYFITFNANASKQNQEILGRLPHGMRYIATSGKLNLTFFRRVKWLLFRNKRLSVNSLKKWIKEEFSREIHRTYGNAKFDTVVQFNGYSAKFILMFSAFDANRVIFVHSDMVQEARTKGNQRSDVLGYAYSEYDHVALVTEDISESTASFLKTPRTFDVSHNLIAYDRIVERGKEEFSFDETTICNKTFEEVQEIVASSSKKLINVGRYSGEKGHDRLVNAFNRVWQDNPDAHLFIIGGYQLENRYDNLCEYVKSLPCANNVVLILSMSNPMPLVKSCDGFILSSFYEGFGLVLVEADILGLPVVSTDIVGPRGFMKKNGGVMVENSDAGVEDGLRKLLNGEIPKLTVDYKEYNRKAIEEFTSLLETK